MDSIISKLENIKSGLTITGYVSVQSAKSGLDSVISSLRSAARKQKDLQARQESHEQQAELFADYVEKQFHHDGRPIRCTGCPGVCWVDEHVAKHWLTWQAAREANNG